MIRLTYVLAWPVALAWRWLANRRAGPGGCQFGDSQCPFEIAILAATIHRAIDTAMLSILAKGFVVHEGALVAQALDREPTAPDHGRFPTRPALHPLERAVLDQVPATGLELEALDERTEAVTGQVRAQLVERGLLMTPAQQRPNRAVACGPLWLVMAASLFLIPIPVALFVILWLRGSSQKETTRDGAILLRRLQRESRGLVVALRRGLIAPTPEDLALVHALWGRKILRGALARYGSALLYYRPGEESD